MSSPVSTRRRAVRWFAVLTFGAAWIPAPTTAHAQLAVDALELSLPLPQGPSVRPVQSFTVTNTGDAATSVTITAQDWDRSLTGENRYFTLGSQPTSCGAKLDVYPSVLFLKSKESATIRVRMDSTAVLAHGCYSILFVETPKPPASAGSGLQYLVRYGVKVYVEPEAVPAGEVVDAEALTLRTRRGTDSAAVAVTFRNTGRRQALTRGSLEIRRADNSVVQALRIEEFATLPGAERRLVVGLPRLPKGSYVVLALLDFGGSEVTAAQIEVEVP